MSNAARVTDQIRGSVEHHAHHIIGYDSDDDPIYCSGHSVVGTQTNGASKTFIDGYPAARLNDEGQTNCACDGRGYNTSSASGKVFIEGKAAVRSGDHVNIHGHGDGVVTTGSRKVFIG